MKQAILKSMAGAAVLALGVAACGGSSSSSSSGSTQAKTGQPLVIESTPLSPMTDNFNPLSSTSTGYLTNSVALYNEPLYIWNYLRPTDPGIPILASGQPAFSNGGKTLTIPVRSGVKWNDGKPFSASDVAFTFNMIKAHPALYTYGAPVVTSASAHSATSVKLNIATAQ
jgi:peptide/nickel transport system substrate-binding protein